MFGKDQDKEKELQETIKKKMKEGWIKSTMFIEALALNEKDAKEALEEHLEKMKKEDKTIIYKIDFKGIKELKNPVYGLEVGYSNIVEIGLITESLDKLVFLAMNYGPTNIEIIEPPNLNISAGEVQGIVNSVADMIHKFVTVKMGGIPVLRKEEAGKQ